MGEYHTYAVHQRREMRAAEATSTQTTTPRPSVAVCIIGRARTLSSPDVFLSIAENATGLNGLGAETSVFYALDLNGAQLSEYEEAFTHIPPANIALFDGEEKWGKPKSCPTYEKCG